MPWNYRRYASPVDPVHKSHLNAITGDYGCPKQFRYSMDARADRGDGAEDERDTVSGKAAAGTAAHETIARALGVHAMRERILAGTPPSREQIAAVFVQEFRREVGKRQVQWYGKDDEGEIVDERVEMIVGVLADMHRYVHSIELVEPGFVAPLGEFWMSGHVDLLYRPKAAPRAYAIADWKTGASKPVQIELDHGWEAGVYSAAVKQGLFLARSTIHASTEPDGRSTARVGGHTVTHWSKYIAEREALERALIDIAVSTAARSPLELEREVQGFADFPVEIYHVHLADYVPYRKAGSKAVKRPEDVRFYGYDGPVEKHRYSAGERRGPGWLPVKLSEYDLPRLDFRLRNVVGMIRMGRFIDNVGERCTRCAYSRDCLTAGYAPRGQERDALERSLRNVTHTDSDLSVDDD